MTDKEIYALNFAKTYCRRYKYKMKKCNASENEYDLYDSKDEFCAGHLNPFQLHGYFLAVINNGG